MVRLIVAVMAVVFTLGAITACYNKEPKGASPVESVR